MLMAQGIQRARYRNGTCPDLLTPGQPTKVRVDLSSTALSLAVGHALRVIVSASADPLYTVNPQNGDDFVGGQPSRAGSINILVGGTTPSGIVIPFDNVNGVTPPDDRPVTQACQQVAVDGGTKPEDGSMGVADGPKSGPGDGGGAQPGCSCRLGRPAHDASVGGALLGLVAMAGFALRRRRVR
jgi:MYXO-CTERM domain-containing protein